MTTVNSVQNNKYTRPLILSSVILVAGGAVGIREFRKFEKSVYKMQHQQNNIPIIQNLKGKMLELTLRTKNGEDFAVWDINPNNSNKYIIYGNGMYSTMAESSQNVYANLLKSDFGIIGFDYPGRGKSTGVLTQKSAQQSLESVYNYLVSKGIKPENIGIIGHSMGCAVAGEFSSKNKLLFTIMLSPFNKAADNVKFFIEKRNLPNFVKQIIKHTPSKLFLLKSTFNNEKFLDKIQNPIFILASNDDKTVPIELTRKLYNKTKNKDNILYLEFKDGEHQVTNEKLQACLDYIEQFKM